MELGIHFVKMNGYGNDFVVIDNRRNKICDKDLMEFAKKICRRRVSIGADGLLLLENSFKYDFKMRLFNPDGAEGEMCGNGARCIAKFASIEGIANKKMVFETLAGEIGAEVNDKYVRITLPEVKIEKILRNAKLTIDNQNYCYTYLFLGVPHCIIFLEEELSEGYLLNLGRKIRFDKEHFPEGVNVNFVQIENEKNIFVRTYERGVEEITLSCGTGSLASAIIYSLDRGIEPPIKARTKGGILGVDFIRNKEIVKNIALAGEVRVIARGELLPQSYID